MDLSNVQALSSSTNGASSAAASFRTAVDESGCGAFWLDDRLNVRRANSAFERFAGRDGAELIGTPIHEIDPEWPYGSPEETFQRLRQTMSTGHATRLARPEGGRWPVQVHVNLLTLGGLECLFGIAVDTSDRQAAEDALLTSEARYRAVTTDQTEFIVRCTPDHFITFCNPAYAKLVRRSDPSEIVGRRGQDLVYEEDVERLNQTLAAITPENPVAGFENLVPTPDGTDAWVSWVIRAIYETDPNGESRAREFQSVGRNVTESRRSQAALARTEARYRSLVEDSPELVSRWTPDGVLTFANSAYCQYFGLDPAVDVAPALDRELAPKCYESRMSESRHFDERYADGGRRYRNVYDEVDALTRQELERRIRATTPDSPLSRMVVGCPRRDGVVRQLEWIQRGLFDDAGQLAEMHCVARDITERLEAESRLAESERRHRTVLDDLSEMVNRFRPGDGLITYANRAFLEAKGCLGKQIVGRMTIFDHLTGEARDYARTQLAAVTPENPSVRALLPLPGPGGATRWEEWTNRALFAPPDPSNPGAPRQILEFQSVGRDVTAELAVRDRQKEREQAAADLAKLTPRERQVLRAVTTGVTNKVVAKELEITERTVEKHRGAAMRKLGVRSAAELIRIVLAAEEFPPYQSLGAGRRPASFNGYNPSMN